MGNIEERQFYLDKNGFIYLSFILSFIFIFSLCLFFSPMWETNDDIGMSMVAHGYGIAAIKSPNLIFSSVLWGYIVSLFQPVCGILGYSIATYLVLIVIIGIVIYGLYQMDAGLIASISVILLVFTRPVIFPQFTINSGLLMVAAVICWKLYVRNDNLSYLAVGCILALFSFLIRKHEALLVFIISLPLISWRLLIPRKSFKIATLVLVSMIVLASYVDYNAYQIDEWNAFNQLNYARAPFTDFNAGESIKQRTDILNRYGYSINDIELISSWFFVDSHIANPVALSAMLSEIGPLSSQKDIISNTWIAIKSLFDPKLAPLMICGIFLSILKPSFNVIVSWFICVSSVILFGILGRPGILRIYIPLFSLLVIAPFFDGCAVSFTRKFFICFTLIVSAIINTKLISSEFVQNQLSAEQVRKGLEGFPENKVVINWGASFPFEAVYPVINLPPSIRSYIFYSLGAFTLAPFSVSFQEQNKGQGMLDLITTEGGISIIANKYSLKRLGIYCREHLHGELTEISAQKYGSINLSTYRCHVNSPM